MFDSSTSKSCHQTLPFLGQGAAMAMEDAYVVAACLAKYFDQPELALVRYDRSRISRCTLIVRKSHEIRKQAFDPALSEETSIAVLARVWQQTRAKEQLDGFTDTMRLPSTFDVWVARALQLLKRGSIFALKEFVTGGRAAGEKVAGRRDVVTNFAPDVIGFGSVTKAGRCCSWSQQNSARL